MEATHALVNNCKYIRFSLHSIASDDYQNFTTKSEALFFGKKMDRHKNAFLIVMWHCFLRLVSSVSIALQAISLDLCKVVDLVRSLKDFIASLRIQFDIFEIHANSLSPTA